VQLLLDTCAMLWLSEDRGLSAAAAAALEEAYRSEETVWVSPISAWEIGLLVMRGRIALSAPPAAWFRRLLSRPGIELCKMEPEVLIDSSSLPGEPPRDPADRIILATARAYQLRVLSRDGQMIAYGRAGHANVIAC
jgi:PIN domain nuclease of toxin-antitoxin system